MAEAKMRLQGKMINAIRSTCRPPTTSDSKTPAIGKMIAKTRRIPLVVVTSGKILRPWSRVGFFPHGNVRVARPVCSNRRSTNATANAVAAKATTIAVMTIA